MKSLTIGLGLALAFAATPTMASSPSEAFDSIAIPIEDAASELAPNQFVWHDTATGEPVSIVVSLSTQRAYVYRGQALIAATTISTGRDGNDTPVGSYAILQKNEKHKSNLYNDAPMPFMQRLTWDGIAIHAGKNPGFPDSHGCVRVPMGFAQKLFAVTSVGTTVVVADDEPTGAPAPFVPMEVETARANAAQLAMVER